MNYYIEELSKYDLTEKEIWDRVYGETCDEDLALAVVEALMQGEVGIYENELGVRIEVFETNTDVYGNKYCTWRMCDTGVSFNVRVESFREMIKANKYRKLSD